MAGRVEGDVVHVYARSHAEAVAGRRLAREEWDALAAEVLGRAPMLVEHVMEEQGLVR